MNPYLSSAELATRWRLNAQTLANWRHAGKGPPFIRVGSRVLYPIEGIEACEKLASDWTDPNNIQSQQST
jgi:hypothetical protein